MQFDPKKTVFLLDGGAFLYRAYYSLRPLHTPQGEPIHAVYSYCRTIKKLLDRFAPHYLVVAWDSKGPTKRHEMYTEYKSTRQAPPQDLFQQKAKIVEFNDIVGIKQIAREATEADDIMYSLGLDYAKAGFQVVLVTSDKDMAQMLSNTIFMFDAFKDAIVDKNSFESLKNIPVAKLTFYYALLGDASDNIPGVKGIGEKTALELVTQFDSLEDMYLNSEQVQKPRIKALLETQKENAFLSEQLFKLQYLDLQTPITELHFDQINWLKARPFFLELNFTSLIKELGVTSQETIVTIEEKINALRKYKFITVNKQQELDYLVHEIVKAGAFACDTETDGFSPMDSVLVGISFCTQVGIAYYLPLAHKDQEQLPYKLVHEALAPLFKDLAISKYFHHAKFDKHILEQNGFELNGIFFDTMIAASLTTKEWQRAGLKFLSAYYFNEQMLTFDEVVKSQKLKDFSYVLLEQATYYAACDAHQTLRLVDLLKKELQQDGMYELYNNVEFPLMTILYEMEKEGIYIDSQELAQLSIKVGAKLDQIEEAIATLVDEPCGSINLNSPKQLQELLFNKLKLAPKKKSAKGTGYSTDQEVLALLAQEHPVPALLMDYRELYKLKSTYIDALPTYINKKTGRIHTTYNQIVVSTGRLASSDPNLQNIPLTSGEYGTAVRNAFKVKEGHLFIAADYSQIELRVLAYLSQDKQLLAAFTQNLDIHIETASKLFGIDKNAVSSFQRQVGKRINFSILYGMTPYGLSKDLRIPYGEAKKYIETYFEQYPGVSLWMDTVIEETKKHGYVTTHWARRRYIPGIYERNKSLFEEACRVAINTKGQGTAAEIMKMGMIALHTELTRSFPDAKMLLQIHDELLISAPHEHVREIEQLMKLKLESVVSWNVPLIVTTRIGSTWAQVSK